MNIDKETERCLLCVRIPFEDILSLVSKFYGPPLNYEIAEKAAFMIRDTYLKNPPYLCGKRPRGIIGGAVYISAINSGHKITQRKLAKALGVHENTIKTSYLRFTEIGLGVKPWKDRTWRR